MLEVYLAQPGVEIPDDTDKQGIAWTRRGLDREGVQRCDLGAGRSGVCMRPLNVSGWAGNINLGGEPRGGRPLGPDGNPVPSRCGPGRLLVVNTFQDEGGPRGGGYFDLSEPQAHGGNTALFCEEYHDMVWDAVSVNMAFMDVQVEMISDFWTLRYVFEPNPLDMDPIFSSPECNLHESRIDENRYLPASVRVMRGDVLLCRKPSADEVCAHEDFQFLDLDTLTFTSSRTSNVHQLAFMKQLRVGQQPDGSWGDVFCNIATCEEGEPYCGFNPGSYDVGFSMSGANRFSLYSQEIDHLDPRHPAHYLTETSSSSEGIGRMDIFHFESDDGTTVEGFAEDLEIVLRFDLNEFLVLPDLLDPGEVEDHSDAELFRKLVPKDMAGRGSPHNFGYRPSLNGWVEVSFRE